RVEASYKNGLNRQDSRQAISTNIRISARSLTATPDETREATATADHHRKKLPSAGHTWRQNYNSYNQWLYCSWEQWLSRHSLAKYGWKILLVLSRSAMGSYCCPCHIRRGLAGGLMSRSI